MNESDEIFEPASADDEDTSAPTWRATVCNGQLVLTSWAPWLARSGPMGELVRAREDDGIAIADLTVLDGDCSEVSVRFYASGRRDQAEDALLEWAQLVGFRRVWLATRVVDIEPSSEHIGAASVRCPTCLASWSDSSPEFWLLVRREHAFPMWCPTCGCELPQWKLDQEMGSTTAASSGSRSTGKLPTNPARRASRQTASRKRRT